MRGGGRHLRGAVGPFGAPLIHHPVGRCIPTSGAMRRTEGVPSRMNPAPPLQRIDPRGPFAIVLRGDDAAASVVLQSARDADGATVAFYAERRRLTHQQ